MTVATFLHLEPDLFDAFPRVLGRLAPRGTTAPAPEVATPRSPKWRLLSAQELAAPGFMTLHALRERGQVVHFVWDFASAPGRRRRGHADQPECREALGAVAARVHGGHVGHHA